MTDGGAARPRGGALRRLREGGPPAPRKGVGRCRSVSCTEESTEGEEEACGTGIARGGGGVSGGGARAANGFGVASALTDADEDVIDGFMILSFSNYQDLQHVMQGGKGDLQGPDLELLPEQPDPDIKEEEDLDIRMEDDILAPPDPLLLLEHLGKFNNNEATTPNQNLLETPAAAAPIRQGDFFAGLDMKTPRVMCQPETIICDTADEGANKVPEPEIEHLRPESPKRDVVQQAPTKPCSPFPAKQHSFPPLQQNGPPSPSTAVAAVTVTANPAAAAPPAAARQNLLPSSTSPSGGVPFPTSLLRQEDFPVSASAKTVSPGKNYDAAPTRGATSNSDVVHSLPYPICSSYSDCPVSGSYPTAGQYSTKYHSGAESVNRDQRLAAHQKQLSSESVYHHQQQDKYAPQQQDSSSSKYAIPRSNSKDGVICEQQQYGGKKESFGDNRFDKNKAVESGDANYRYHQSYAHEKNCDLLPAYRKSSTNNVQNNFQTNELLSSSNGSVVKSVNDQIAGSRTADDCYPNGNKTKVLNRTSYYQSIVNKSHSRQKSSRRVLPASAYESTKQIVNSYNSNLKTDLSQSHSNKTNAQYSTQQYNAEVKKGEYPLAPTNNVYNNYNYKTDSTKHNVNSNASYTNWTDPRYNESKNYKVNSEQCITNCRNKQLTNSSSKNYTYHYHSSNNNSSRSHVDSHTKVSQDPTIAYAHSDYYQKGSVSHSKPDKHSNSSSDNYKIAGYPAENASYKNSYQHVKSATDANSRNAYQNHDSSSLKGYQKDFAPAKQSAEDAYTFKVHNDSVNSHTNYSSLKASGPIEHRVDPPKPIHDVTTPTPVDPITEVSPYYPIPPAPSEKTSFYSYHQEQLRKSPPPKPQQLEPAKPPIKDISESPPGKLLPSASPPPAYDYKSRGHPKTLWSPTAATTAVTSSSIISNRAEVTPTSSRDSHSSHSNSSISSLSQLSQSFGSAPQGSSSLQLPKEFSTREGRSTGSSNGHSRSSSRNTTPVCNAGPVTSSAATSASYSISGSLTSLIFSKPSWTSPSVTSSLSSLPAAHSSALSSSSALPLGSPVPSVLPLAPSLPGGPHHHHSSPFQAPHSSQTAGPHGMFAPPLPPSAAAPGPQPPLSSPLASAGSSPFGGESLFAPPTDQDLLRRELDTRFLASQDRSINVPPPPYLRAEMHQHQHQHTHMHQHSPFLPPPIGGSPLLPPAAHLYDKFPKMDASFYGRNALGLPGYPSISPLLAPGAASATPTPFAPPGHMAAFQPKMNSMVKAKSMKSGRWCAMHVRIAWEIYHHQQKQQQADSQKGGSGKGVTDLLRPSNHLFGSIPRPHELGFSSSLLGAAASVHSRSPYDVSPQHPAYMGPSPAHLGLCHIGMTPFARPGYPGFGAPGNSFGGLGSLAGLTGASMLAAAGRGDLGPAGYLGVAQDPWGRLHRTPPSFAPPSPASSSWGGLKAEAERDRQLHGRKDEKEEKERQRKAEKESEKAKETSREKRELEKQKERDRAYHGTNNVDALRNGESSSSNERGARDRDREWGERRETSRSPIRHKASAPATFEGAACNSAPSSHAKPDVKVKVEKKEEDTRKDSPVLVVGGPDRTKSASSEPPAHPPEPLCDYLPRGAMPQAGLMGLSPAEQLRLAGPHFWGPLPPLPQSPSEQRYRELQLREQLMDREQLMQKYASLSSMMPLLPERYREAELARHLSGSEAAARDIERQLQADRDRQVFERAAGTGRPPPPLRPNDSPYAVPPPGMFPSLAGNPFLNSLCPGGASYPPRTKEGTSPLGNGVPPPPLIPCVGGAQPQSGSPSATPSPLHLKSSSSGASEGAREHYSSSSSAKERRDSGSAEVDSQSR